MARMDGRFMKPIGFRQYPINIHIMTVQEIIKSQISESARVKEIILNDSSLQDLIKRAAEVCVEAYKNGKKTMFAGNGGSAADAQHLAGEFVSKF